MCKYSSMIYLGMVSVMCCAGASLAVVVEKHLVGYWDFEEGGGVEARDLSKNGHHGTLLNATYAEGGWNDAGYSLQFDGSSAVVELGPVDVEGPGISLMAWINPDSFAINDGRIITKANEWGADDHWWMLSTINNTDLRFRLKTNDGAGVPTLIAGGTDLVTGEWQHVVASWDSGDGTMRLYKNAVEVGSMVKGGDAVATNPAIKAAIGSQPSDAFNTDASHVAKYFDGRIDEARIYSRALTVDEILSVIEGDQRQPELAFSPNPEDLSGNVSRDTSLEWLSGVHAQSHNVYVGTGFDDVNDADTGSSDLLVAEGHGAERFAPGRLDFSQTYYWRVDEVNGAPDFTVFKGQVWQFTTEPLSVPIADISVTASSSFGPSTPDNTVNGSGLVDDLHGTNAADMWVSGSIPASIQYEFDKPYRLHELWIWNSNQLVESFVGFGAKDIILEISIDGETWQMIEDVPPLAQAPGAEGYAHNNVIDLKNSPARWARLTVNSVHGIAPQASLSEVRFFAFPNAASMPTPAAGAMDVPPDVTLSWARAGREADQHQVYFGESADSLALVTTTGEQHFDTSALDLQLGQTYAWRVDEVNEAMDPTIWQGDTWAFTVVDRLVVDDMETYRDKEFLEIWATWADGFEDPANGSLVGNGATGTPETSIVNGGRQSLPIHIDNTAAPASEATRSYDTPQDWTRSGIQTLVLSFNYSADNTGDGQLYVKVNDAQVLYPDALADNAGQWVQWDIDLAAVGTDLSRVETLTVGIQGPGASGVVFVDDVGLY